MIVNNIWRIETIEMIKLRPGWGQLQQVAAEFGSCAILNLSRSVTVIRNLEKYFHKKMKKRPRIYLIIDNRGKFHV